jgi:hypothetical protein
MNTPMFIFTNPVWSLRLNRGGSDWPYNYGYTNVASANTIRDIRELNRMSHLVKDEYGIAKQIRNLESDYRDR